MTVFVAGCATWTKPSYGAVQYPEWAHVIGWLLLAALAGTGVAAAPSDELVHSYTVVEHAVVLNKVRPGVVGHACTSPSWVQGRVALPRTVALG